MKKKFQSQNREYEVALLQKGDPEFKDTVEYLKPLIEDILASFSMTQKTYDKLYMGMVKDIPIAAKRFIESKKTMGSDHKFNIYFSWYISERLNKTGKEVRRIK